MHGPVTVGFKATKEFFSWRAGKDEVFSSCKERYRFTEIDHAVLLIGWTAKGDWIIKNSWGEDWGYEGFAIISKERDCGITLIIDVIEI